MTTERERTADIRTIRKHLKRKLGECRDRLDRLEVMLIQSKQANEPPG